jgi:hypothetical protein
LFVTGHGGFPVEGGGQVVGQPFSMSASNSCSPSWR